MIKLSILFCLFITNFDIVKDTSNLKNELIKEVQEVIEQKSNDKTDLKIEKLNLKVDSMFMQNSFSSDRLKKLENNLSKNETEISFFKNNEPDKNQNTCANIIRTIATVIAAIIAGLTLYRVAYNQKIRRLEELEEYFIEIIELLNEPIQDQASSFLVLSDNLRNENFMETTIKSETSLNFINIDDIDNKDLYKIFVSNRKGDKKIKVKEFAKLGNSLLQIKDIKNTLKSKCENCFRKLNSFIPIWQENFGKITSYYDNLIRSVNMKNPQLRDLKYDRFLYEFAKLYLEWDDKNKKVDPFANQLSLVEPLHKLCKMHVKDDRAFYLLNFTKNCLSTYSSIKFESNKYSNLFQKYANDLTANKEIIQKSLENLLQIKKVSKLILLFS